MTLTEFTELADKMDDLTSAIHLHHDDTFLKNVLFVLCHHGLSLVRDSLIALAKSDGVDDKDLTDALDARDKILRLKSGIVTDGRVVNAAKTWAVSRALNFEQTGGMTVLPDAPSEVQ